MYAYINISIFYISKNSMSIHINILQYVYMYIYTCNIKAFKILVVGWNNRKNSRCWKKTFLMVKNIVWH